MGAAVLVAAAGAVPAAAKAEDTAVVVAEAAGVAWAGSGVLVGAHAVARAIAGSQARTIFFTTLFFRMNGQYPAATAIAKGGAVARSFARRPGKKSAASSIR